MIISPSVASSNLLKIGEEIDFAVKYFDDLHLDIEDGYVTTGITFGMKMIKQIYEAYGDIHRSVHVEYHNPVKWLDTIASVKPDIVHIQIDFIDDDEKLKTIRQFKDKGLKTGISLSSLDGERMFNDVYKACLEESESVLFCTNVVGDPLAAFSEEMFEMALKIARTHNKKLWLDGGITWDMIPRLKEYPEVEAVVMGRGVYKDRDYSLKMAEKYGVLKK